MRIRTAILVVTVAAALSACSDGGDDDDTADPSDPLTEITVECDEFQETATKISDAQADMYAGTGDPSAIETLVAELEALKDGAPEDVQNALTDMQAAFRDAEELLRNPTPEKQAELFELAPELEANGQTITEYVTSQCD